MMSGMAVKMTDASTITEKHEDLWSFAPGWKKNSVLIIRDCRGISALEVTRIH